MGLRHGELDRLFRLDRFIGGDKMDGTLAPLHERWAART